MKYQSWNFATVSDEAVSRLTNAGYPYLVSCVLSSRGINDEEHAADFLAKDDSLTYSPFLMKDMDVAVNRINEAIDRHEKIAGFGDYDVDGITATCILVDYLASHGADVIHYIPRRIEDGYGLSEEALTSLRQLNTKLLITVDCGITGVDEVSFAKSLGMDVVVTDHHECKEVLPDAVAVVDPHREDCPYPFKHLAGCGVSMKLVLALGGSDREEALFSRYCTLAAIGTIADVMLMSGENRTIVQRGLNALSRSDFIGLHALLEESGLGDKEISSVQIGFVLAPRINAAGRMGAADMAADLLLCDDPVLASQKAKELCALNRERQNVEQDIYSQAEDMIQATPDHLKHALVLSSDLWHQGVVGIVASRLSEKYSRPSFMIHLNGGVGKGSCRSWGGFNLFNALDSCNDLLLGYGGHELAAGFTIDEANIPEFRERMNKYCSEFRGGETPISVLDIDVVINQCQNLTLPELEGLDTLEPYGSGNARPLFCLLGATLLHAQSVGQNRHVKIKLGKGPAQFDGIFFSVNLDDFGCKEGDRVDAAFYLQINEFRGQRSVQLQMVDIRPSLTPSVREQESLDIVGSCLRFEHVDGKNIHHLLPNRAQFESAWHYLEKVLSNKATEVAYLPFVRSVSYHIGKQDSFLRAAFILSVFEERGILSAEHNGDNISLKLTSEGKHVLLEECPYLLHLQKLSGKGGDLS